MIKQSDQQGFTLIELMVVIAIIILTTSILIMRPQRGGQNLVTNAAIDLEVALREAQSYSAGVRGEGGDFEGTYGINFAASDNDSVTLFVDSGNQEYDYDVNDTIISEQVLLGEGQVVLREIERVGAGGGTSPMVFGSGGNVAITFQRPETRAHIKYQGSSGQWDAARIKLGNLDNSALACLFVASSGLMYVEETCSLTP